MGFNEKAYTDLCKRREDLNRRAQEAVTDGDRTKAKEIARERHKVGADIRPMEREAARDGLHYMGGQKIAETDPKRSLQEEYIRKFKRMAGPGESEPVVKIIDRAHPADRPFVGTLSAFHRKRLLGGK